MVGKWEPNKSLTVKRYLGYKGPAPHAQQIKFIIYTTTDTAFTALQAGQVDITEHRPRRLRAGGRPVAKDVIAFNAPAIDYLGFPLYNSYFSNPLIREAISLAIDRPAINNALFGGLLTPATSILPPAEAGAPTGLCKYCTYNPTLARKLLAEAVGWKGGARAVVPEQRRLPAGVPGHRQRAHPEPGHQADHLQRVALHSVPGRLGRQEGHQRHLPGPLGGVLPEHAEHPGKPVRGNNPGYTETYFTRRR